MLHYFRMFHIQFQILKRHLLLLLLLSTTKKKKKRKIFPTAHATSSGKLNIKYSSIFTSQNEYPEERFFEYLSYKRYKKKKRKKQTRYKVTELSLSLYRKFHLKFCLKSTSYIKFTLKFSVYKTFLLRYNRGTSAPTVSKEIFPEF